MNRIRQVRSKKGITQAELANAIGMSRQGLAYYENNQREPKLETWQKLADYLGVSVPYLQGFSDSLANGASRNSNGFGSFNFSEEANEAKINDQSLIDMLYMIYKQNNGYSGPDFIRKMANLTQQQKRQLLEKFNNFFKDEITQDLDK
ncbi:helix-turn-helix domain-containing protein [Limosilactobacillus mucosae]|jgi:transcriptional regulator with XRE-family HTH domain|uniref:helix-turn-helix domain-containing protein n=1 Tax=Limosilactobacillus mucosae TaxID=97478 RepID=UPI0022E24DF1|nr:helix-turn-helix transcriptional regulator [Limosilactobacillus mucosae]